MSEQQQVNKFLRDLNGAVDITKTQNTFSPDPIVNRAEQVRRDDDNVQDPEIGLYDIDYAVKSFIEKTIKPTVVQDGETVPVPVMYAAPEKWTSIQADGFMRDAKGKIIAPVIVFNRTAMSRRPEYIFNKVLDSSDNRIVHKSHYTKQNRYDAFSQLTNSVPTTEYYTVSVPDYIDLTYSMILWCDYTTQVNRLAEQIIYYSGKAWGEKYKFMVKADNFSFQTTNTINEDRLVRATVDFTVKAQLVQPDHGLETNVKKTYTPSKLLFTQEAVSNINDIPRNSFSSGSRLT